MFYGPECPYLYKGKQDLSFEEGFDVLVTNVDSRRICTKQPIRVQENAAFVIQRSALKGKGDWLVTDLGYFSNLGHTGKVLQVEDGDILASTRWPRRVEVRFELNKDEYLVLSTYWKHAKYSDYSRITTVVSKKGGHELDLALVQYQYDGEEHHVSPKKHPRTKKLKEQKIKLRIPWGLHPYMTKYLKRLVVCSTWKQFHTHHETLNK